jgi:hypothetical protein
VNSPVTLEAGPLTAGPFAAAAPAEASKSKEMKTMNVRFMTGPPVEGKQDRYPETAIAKRKIPVVQSGQPSGPNSEIPP